MATGVSFEGANVLYKAPSGQEDRVHGLATMQTDHFITSCWELSPEEMAEVQRTGRVFLTVLSPELWPTFVGSETSTRSLTADYGKALPKQKVQQ